MTESKQRGGQKRRKYPSISLDVAILRAQQLYEAERRNPVPVNIVVQHWGYKNAQSGVASTVYSAVKQFGLLDESGVGPNRTAAISNTANAILHAPHDIAQNAIRQAALEPPIHRVVWNHYDGPSTGSDHAFRWYLTQELGFSDRGAVEFVKQYHTTMQFAGIDKDAGDDVISTVYAGDLSEKPSEHPDIPPLEVVEEEATDAELAALRRTPQPTDVWIKESGERTYVPAPEPAITDATRRHIIPLIGGKQVVLEGEFPLSEQAWDGFINVLKAFKPGLVSDDARDD